MRREITMPRMGAEMKKGVVCAWLKQEGDRVCKGEPLFEMEAEKVVSQVEAEADGVLSRLVVEEGEEVAPETTIAILEEDA